MAYFHLGTNPMQTRAVFDGKFFRKHTRTRARPSKLQFYFVFVHSKHWKQANKAKWHLCYAFPSYYISLQNNVITLLVMIFKWF